MASSSKSQSDASSKQTSIAHTLMSSILQAPTHPLSYVKILMQVFLNEVQELCKENLENQ